ncbi:hypothetical protein SCOCK_210085 [Actinacidiphila cocklensis]|uniref:Uncharacterized protein n=1 Tax=Actinacidiphila cocklensis TaxID=887465 RepID=A0A9W4GSH9_9ACTN|nr:hypothetical protein SCOCK_210085 [Actinacidiphila cocklensis]
MDAFGTPRPARRLRRRRIRSPRLRQDQRQSPPAATDNRRLQRVLYTSALISIRGCEESRCFYGRKRAEGKRHARAVPSWPAATSTSSGTPPRPTLLRAHTAGATCSVTDLTCCRSPSPARTRSTACHDYGRIP